jgi:predicted XRE-type DNA-binding protein
VLTAKHKLEFKTGKRTAKTIVEAGTQPEQPTPGRLPRITKMMALAIRLDHLIKTGQVTDQAELARVGHVSRARLTQIMDLNLLAPDIQEEILFLEKSNRTYVAMIERDVRKIAKIPDWSTQRCRWRTSQ